MVLMLMVVGNISYDGGGNKYVTMITMTMAKMRLTPVAEKLARLDWVRTTVPAIRNIDGDIIRD